MFLSRTVARARGGVRTTLKRSIFINTESTPNPNSLKFLPGREVLPEEFGTGRGFELGQRAEIQKSPLAVSLFGIDGVQGVYLGRDFISVTKTNEFQWQMLKPQIFSSIFDFFSDDRAVITDKPVVSDTAILDSDDEVVATIKELIETRIRPYVQEDGGDIHFVKYEEDVGLVHVRLAGSCVGCPSSSITLRNGVENMLTHYIPEVKGIVDATGTEDAENSFANDLGEEGTAPTDNGRTLKWNPTTDTATA